MLFLSSKTAAVAAAALPVRLPRLVACGAGPNLASFHPKGPRPALVGPPDPRGRHRADQSRYQAKCRVAMSF